MSDAERQSNRREGASKEGFCARCSVGIPAAGKKNCAKCLAEIVQYNRERRRRAKRSNTPAPRKKSKAKTKKRKS